MNELNKFMGVKSNENDIICMYVLLIEPSALITIDNIISASQSWLRSDSTALLNAHRQLIKMRNSEKYITKTGNLGLQMDTQW